MDIENIEKAISFNYLGIMGYFSYINMILQKIKTMGEKGLEIRQKIIENYEKAVFKNNKKHLFQIHKLINLQRIDDEIFQIFMKD